MKGSRGIAILPCVRKRPETYSLWIIVMFGGCFDRVLAKSASIDPFYGRAYVRSP